MEQAAPLRYPALYESLSELALDLHWSWSHTTDKVWRQLDPELWDLTHNPFVVLQTVSHDRINAVLDDPIVREIIEELVEVRRERAVAPAWFQQAHPNAPLSNVAYFSMEFMLSEVLPIYSGGLGNVAGDHLKSASDLGVPITGIGLLYQQGYSRQVINADGSQQYLFPYNDPGQLPITPLRTPNGEWLRIRLYMPGYTVWLRTWKVQVGRVTLLLLDSNDAANYPLHRGITSELYGAGSELRLAQELVLGIGGWRLLEELGLKPEVMHLNEGHAAFAVLERAAYAMREHDLTFAEALATTRAGNLFTTHTAIGAGFDRFPPPLIEQYLGNYAKERLHIPLEELLALGRLYPDDPSELFNAGYLAIRGCGRMNGVSKLHRSVSQRMLAPLFPRWPLAEVPVGAVTNGVHMPTWDSPEADKLWTETCGKERWLGTVELMERHMHQVSDERLWHLRTTTKKDMLEYIRTRYSRQLAVSGRSEAEVRDATHVFDPSVLTLGFARRFVAYKRPNLLLHDPDRLQRLLTNAERPVQLIVAGKPHPADGYGKSLIQQWIRFIEQRGLQHRIIFLSDYDMLLTEHLVQGVDVWINTPQRPWEACGTSGMKLLVNGGLNASVLDGWWDEAYAPDLGWAIGDRKEEAGLERDAADAADLYRVLEEEIIPEYYRREGQGLPLRWIARIRESMARLTAFFSANRAVREYTSDYYLPAALAYGERAAGKGIKAKQIVAWKKDLEQKWSNLRFERVNMESRAEGHFFTTDIYLGDLAPGMIKVELFADGHEGGAPFRQEMILTAHNGNLYSFSTTVATGRPAADYTPRIIPRHPSLAIPLECPLILWAP